PVLERLTGQRAGVVLGAGTSACWVDLDGFVVAITVREVPLLPNAVALAAGPGTPHRPRAPPRGGRRAPPRPAPPRGAPPGSPPAGPRGGLPGPPGPRPPLRPGTRRSARPHRQGRGHS